MRKILQTLNVSIKQIGHGTGRYLLVLFMLLGMQLNAFAQYLFLNVPAGTKMINEGVVTVKAGDDLTLTVPGIPNETQVKWEYRTKPKEPQKVLEGEHGASITVSDIQSDIEYIASYKSPFQMQDIEYRLLISCASINVNTDKPCPSAPISINLKGGQFADGRYEKNEEGSRWENLKQFSSDEPKPQWIISADRDRFKVRVSLEYGYYSSEKGRVTTNEIEIVTDKECKASCLTTTTGDFYVGTDFDPNKVNASKVPQDIVNYFGDYNIELKEAGITNYWLGSNAIDFFDGQVPFRDKETGMVGKNNYWFCQSLNARAFELNFSPASAFVGKNYTYKMRMYLQKGKNCNPDPNSDFIVRTGYGSQYTDRLEAVSYRNSDGTMIKKAESIYFGDYRVRMSDLVDYRDIERDSMIMVEITYDGLFPDDKYDPRTGSYNGMKHFSFFPEFAQMNCWKVAIDYISVEVEDVCVSPSVLCAGEYAVAHVAGLPADLEFRWYKKVGDDWKEDVSNRGKQNAQIVAEAGITQYQMRVNVPRVGEKTIDFTVRGNDCSYDSNLKITSDINGPVNVGSKVKFNSEFSSSSDYANLTYKWLFSYGGDIWMELPNIDEKESIDYTVYSDIKYVKCQASYIDTYGTGEEHFVESNVIELDVNPLSFNVEVVGDGVRNVNSIEKEVPAFQGIKIKMVDLPSNVSNPKISLGEDHYSFFKPLTNAKFNENDNSWSLSADRSGWIRVEADVEVPAYDESMQIVRLEKDIYLRLVYSSDGVTQLLFEEDFGYFIDNEYHYVKYKDGKVVDADDVIMLDASLPDSIKWVDDQNGFVRYLEFALNDPRTDASSIYKGGKIDSILCWSTSFDMQPYRCWCENGYRVEDNFYAILSNPSMADGGAKSDGSPRDYWSGSDHTVYNDAAKQGAMLMANVPLSRTSTVYERDFEIDGACTDVMLLFSAFVSNPLATGTVNNAGFVSMEIYKKGGSEIVAYETERYYGSDSWSNFNASFPLHKAKTIEPNMYTLRISAGGGILLDDISLKIYFPNVELKAEVNNQIVDDDIVVDDKTDGLTLATFPGIGLGEYIIKPYYLYQYYNAATKTWENLPNDYGITANSKMRINVSDFIGYTKFRVIVADSKETIMSVSEGLEIPDCEHRFAISNTLNVKFDFPDDVKPVILNGQHDTVNGYASPNICGMTYDALKNLMAIPTAYDEYDDSYAGQRVYIEPMVKRYFFDPATNDYNLVSEGFSKWKDEVLPVGLSKLEFIFTDKAGNADTCVKYVNVVDADVPYIDCSEINPNPYFPVVKTGSSNVLLGDIIDVLNRDYYATKSCADEMIPGVLTLDGLDFLPLDYPLEIGKDLNLSWVFRDAAGNVATCPQVVRLCHETPLVVHCENAADIDTVMPTVNGIVPGDRVITKCPFGIDVVTNDTIWGVPHRSDSLKISDPFPTGHTHIVWTMVSPSNLRDTAKCEQNIHIIGVNHFDIDCNEIRPISRTTQTCGPVDMVNLLQIPHVMDPTDPNYMCYGRGVRSDNPDLDPQKDPYPLGQTYIKWIFTDGAKTVSDSCTQLVDIRSTLPLLVNCDDIIFMTAPSGRCEVSSEEVLDLLAKRGYPYAKHPCLTDSFVGTPRFPDGWDQSFFVGQNETIIWEFIDSTTHTLVDPIATCKQSIVILSEDSVWVDCEYIANIEVKAEGEECYAVLDIPHIYGKELCAGYDVSGIGTRSDGKQLDEPYPVGDTYITWKFNGIYMNPSTCVSHVSVAGDRELDLDCDMMFPQRDFIVPDCDSAEIKLEYRHVSDPCVAGYLIEGEPFIEKDGSVLPLGDYMFPIGNTTVYWQFRNYSNSVIELCRQEINVRTDAGLVINRDSIYADTIKIEVKDGECWVDASVVRDILEYHYPVAKYPCGFDSIVGIPTRPNGLTMKEPFHVGINEIDWMFVDETNSLTDEVFYCTQIVQVGDVNIPPVDCGNMPNKSIVLAPFVCDIEFYELQQDIYPVYDLCTDLRIDPVVTRSSMPGMIDVLAYPFHVGVDTLFWNYNFGSYNLVCSQVISVMGSTEPVVYCDTLENEIIVLPEDVCDISREEILASMKKPFAYDYCSQTEFQCVPELMTVSASGDTTYSELPTYFGVGEYKISWLVKNELLSTVSTRCEKNITIKSSNAPKFDCSLVMPTLLVDKSGLGEIELNADMLPMPATYAGCNDEIVYAHGYIQLNGEGDFFNLCRFDADSSKATYLMKAPLGIHNVKWIFENSYSTAINVCEQMVRVRSSEGMTMVDVPVVDIPDFIYNGEIQMVDIPESPYYTVSVDTLPSAGIHTVVLSLNDKENSAWEDGTVGDKIIHYAIAKAPVDIPELDSTAFVYYGDTVVYTLPENEYYSVQGEVQPSEGTINVVVSLNDTVNYSWSDGTTDDLLYTLVISPADTVPEIVQPETIIVSADTITLDKPGDYVYDLVFDSLAHEQGFVDVSGESGVGGITVPIPDSIVPGVYDVTVVITNPDSTVVEKEVKLMVPYPNTLIVRLLYDVLTVDNASKEFVSYQWYKNGKKIDGATQQFYCDLDGIRGIYKVEVVNTAGDTLFITEREFDYIAPMFNFTLCKNPVRTFEDVEVRIEGIADPEVLSNTSLFVYDMEGVAVVQKIGVKVSNVISIGNVGEYIVVVRTANGKAMSKHLLVK